MTPDPANAESVRKEILDAITEAGLLTPSQFAVARDSLSVTLRRETVEIFFGFLGETNLLSWDGTERDLRSVAERQADSYVTTLQHEFAEFGTIE